MIKATEASQRPEMDELQRSMSGGGKTVFCVLCYHGDQLVVLKCGHILCQPCAEKVLNDEKLPTYRKCPIDRKKFSKFSKLFL